MRQFYFLIIAFIVFPAATAHAGIVKGKVVDSKKLPLPYASIYIQGTTMGSSAGADGNFELNLQPGTYKIICQFIGYKQTSFNISIVGNETIEHNFMLEDESVQMKEVVIHANTEDPAYAIIRSAIKRRPYHLSQIETFQSDIYLKGVIHTREIPKRVLGQKVTAADLGVDTNGKGILFLAEENASYYTRDGKSRTVIHSVRESGNPGGVGLSRFPPVISFYRNDVSIVSSAPRGFISPISDFALNFYKYKLEGEFKEGDKTIYKIRVTPKRLYEPAFTGTVYISDDDWALHSLDLSLTKLASLDLFDTLKVSQVYIPVEKDKWLIKDQVIYFAINILGFDAVASFVTVYNNQEVNGPIPDSMFSNNVISSYDKIANRKDTAYWTQTRPVALEKDEKIDFVQKDSINKVQESPAFKDSVRRVDNKVKITKLLLSTSVWKTHEDRTIFSLNPVLLSPSDYNGGMVNYNTVEGLNIAPRLNWHHRIDSGRAFDGEIAARYGVHNTHFDPIARLEYVMNDREWIGRKWLIGVAGGKYVFQYDPENPVSPTFNTFSTLFWRENDYKIYERTDASVYVNRAYGNGIKWNLRLSYQQRDPLENTTYYNFRDKGRGELASDVPPHLLTVITNDQWVRHDAALAHFFLSYQPAFKFTQYPDYKIGYSNWPVFSVTYDKGIPDILNSVVNYDKWRVSVEGNKRLKLLGSIAYNIAAGGFANAASVSIPDLMHLFGNRGIGFASAYLHSFQFAQYYDWSNAEPIYGEGHLEYSMYGLLSNKVPFLRKARWYFVAGTNDFYATAKDYYTEAFFGVTNLGFKNLRLIRIDFVQSWDSRGGTNSGIRFGVNAIGLVTAKPAEKNVEW